MSIEVTDAQLEEYKRIARGRDAVGFTKTYAGEAINPHGWKFAITYRGPCDAADRWVLDFDDTLSGFINALIKRSCISDFVFIVDGPVFRTGGQEVTNYYNNAVAIANPRTRSMLAKTPFSYLFFTGNFTETIFDLNEEKAKALAAMEILEEDVFPQMESAGLINSNDMQRLHPSDLHERYLRIAVSGTLLSSAKGDTVKVGLGGNRYDRTINMRDFKLNDRGIKTLAGARAILSRAITFYEVMCQVRPMFCWCGLDDCRIYPGSLNADLFSLRGMPRLPEGRRIPINHVPAYLEPGWGLE
jgi:hypothetical protein